MLSCKERGLMTLKISLICKPNEIQLYTTIWLLKFFLTYLLTGLQSLAIFLSSVQEV